MSYIIIIILVKHNTIAITLKQVFDNVLSI